MNRQNAKAPNREPDKELDDLARLRRRSGGYGVAKARLRRRPPSPAKPATAWSRRSACGAEAESGGYGVAKARRVIGAAIEVHKALGPGYLESAYEEALAVEFCERGIPFERQKPFQVRYKARRVAEGRLDFLVAGQLVLEIKALDRLAPVHKAQVISYLKATGHHLGLLINFNEAVLPDGLQRIILSE